MLLTKPRRNSIWICVRQCSVPTMDAMTSSSHWPLVVLVLVFALLEGTHAIGCFKCTSINHNNRKCEDTFNNTGNFYKADCWDTRRGRTGLFPGTQCIKMIAEDKERNYSVVVRNCVVDDGGTNSETEIGRHSHCGWMRVLRFNGQRMRGCILSCDTDACNGGKALYPGVWGHVLAGFLFLSLQSTCLRFW